MYVYLLKFEYRTVIKSAESQLSVYGALSSTLLLVHWTTTIKEGDMGIPEDI